LNFIIVFHCTPFKFINYEYTHTQGKRKYHRMRNEDYLVRARSDVLTENSGVVSCDAASMVEWFPDVSETLLSFETPGNTHRTQRHILGDLNSLPGQSLNHGV